MVIEKFEINGFEFNVLVAVFGSGNGIVIEPETAQLDNPDYIEALKRALLVYKLADRYCWVVHQYTYEYRSIKRIADDDIQEWLNICNQILDGEILAFPEDVIAQASEIQADLAREQERRREVERKRRKPRPGFVYLLREVNGPHYKIGRTKNPDDRRETFEVKLPYRVEYEAVIPTDDMVKLESELKARYAQHCAGGEWFALEPADVAYIKSLAQERV